MYYMNCIDKTQHGKNIVWVSGANSKIGRGDLTGDENERKKIGDWDIFAVTANNKKYFWTILQPKGH